MLVSVEEVGGAQVLVALLVAGVGRAGPLDGDAGRGQADGPAGLRGTDLGRLAAPAGRRNSPRVRGQGLSVRSGLEPFEQQPRNRARPWPKRFRRSANAVKYQARVA